MDNDKIRQLVNRAVALDQRRPLDEKEIVNVEKKLSVVLPDDFKYISKYYDYGFLSNFDFYNFKLENEHSVIRETLDCRQNVALPSRYLLLYQDDASIIIWETKSSVDETTPVIYCSIEDAYNLAEGRPLEYNPTIFESFTDFFEYLIEQEEEERRLQGAGG